MFQEKGGFIKMEKKKYNVQEILDEIGKILIKKNIDYGGASFDLGLWGNLVHIWDKVNRYKTLVEKGSPEVQESIQDTLKDIIGYAVIGLIIQDIEKNCHSLQERQDIENNVKLIGYDNRL